MNALGAKVRALLRMLKAFLGKSELSFTPASVRLFPFLS